MDRTFSTALERPARPAPELPLAGFKRHLEQVRARLQAEQLAAEMAAERSMALGARRQAAGVRPGRSAPYAGVGVRNDVFLRPRPRDLAPLGDGSGRRGHVARGRMLAAASA